MPFNGQRPPATNRRRRGAADQGRTDRVTLTAWPGVMSRNGDGRSTYLRAEARSVAVSKLPEPLQARPAGPRLPRLPRCATRHRFGTRRYTDRVVRQIGAFFERVASAGHSQRSAADAAA